MDKKIAFIAKLFFLIIVASLAFSSCTKENELSEEDQKLLDNAKQQKAENLKNVAAKSEILQIMQEAYLWYDKIPAADTTTSADPESFYYSLLYTALDKWSFILNSSEYSNFAEGKYYGHGFGIAIDVEGNIRVSYVFKNTQAYRNGIRRGWKFVRVNYQVPLSLSHLSELLGATSTQVTNSIYFQKPDGSYTTLSLTKEEVTMNTILNQTVFNINGKSTGYLALQSFMGDSITVINDFNQAFNNFNANNVTQLIIDLRYNGGGALDYAQYLANLILGNRFKNQLFVEEEFNNLIDPYMKNKTSYISALNLSMRSNIQNIIFLTTDETASASELMISCLKPYVNVKTVGTRTAGKPVGMYTLEMEKSDYYLVPIMFVWKNSLNQIINYTGIPADKLEYDDLMHEMGDTTESCLKQAVYYIRNGAFKNSTKSGFVTKGNDLRGYDAYRNAF